MIEEEEEEEEEVREERDVNALPVKERPAMQQIRFTIRVQERVHLFKQTDTDGWFVTKHTPILVRATAFVGGAKKNELAFPPHLSSPRSCRVQ